MYRQECNEIKMIMLNGSDSVGELSKSHFLMMSTLAFGVVLQLLTLRLGVPGTIFIQFLTLLIIGLLLSRRKYWVVVLCCGALVWLGCSVFNMYYLDPTGSPDALRYRENYEVYRLSPSAYFQEAWGHFSGSSLYDVSSYIIVGVTFYPLIDLVAGGRIDQGFMVLNFMFAVLAFIVFSKCIKGEESVSYKKRYAFYIWLMSPVVIFHYQVFSKDILSVALAVVSTYFLIERRYFYFFVFLVLATALRPYSIAIIFVVFCFVEDKNKLALAGVAGSLVIVLLVAGLVGVINSMLVAGYMPISPTVFHFKIERWDYLPLYFEAAFVLLLFLFVFPLLKNIEFLRNVVVPVGCAVLIYSCVLTVLGKYIADYNSMAYDVGTASNNALRKKLPILFMYYYLVVEAVSRYRMRGFGRA